MSEVKLVHFHFDKRAVSNADEFLEGLEELSVKSADSLDLLELFSNAISCLYQHLPDGMRNYSGENPRIGKIYIPTYSENPSRIDLMFTSSGYYKKLYRLLVYDLADIDLRTRIARLWWKQGQNYCRGIPKRLMRDTEIALPMIGLKISEEYHDMNNPKL